MSQTYAAVLHDDHIEWEGKGAEAAIPQAWANLALEPRLADLLAAEVESVCGFQPEASDVAAFLASLRPAAGALPAPSVRRAEALTTVRKAQPERAEAAAAGSWIGKGVVLPAGTELRGQYKRTERLATVENGHIMYGGKPYRTPSAAGSAAIGGKAVNGWTFWEARHPGDVAWRALDHLRDDSARHTRSSTGRPSGS